MQRSTNSRITNQVQLSNVEKYRQDFLNAETRCQELMAQTEASIHERGGIGQRIEQKMSMDAAIDMTMESLDNLINEPSLSLEDVLTKLDVIHEILTGTDQSPSEQLAISARNDLLAILSSAKAA